MCASAAFALVAASAQQRDPPLPPPRPTTLPQPESAPAPQQPLPAPATADETFDIDHPPMLPAASKKRMSDCGHEWDALKQAGKDLDIGWREFATRCLTR